MLEDKFSYKQAGVDIDASNEALKRVKKIAATTFRKGVLTDIGGFGGMFALEPGRYTQPVLVSGCDGVGTKLKIAFLLNKHDTIGIDCVAMCANDILAQGAAPLFFLDYISVGKLETQQVEQIISGIADGCRQAGSALIGGETAEMPGFYPQGEYDLAGFIVGIVEKEDIIDGRSIQSGDRVIGLPSSGLHSNGYSLVRKILIDHACLNLDSIHEELGCSLGAELLRPTKIYVSLLLPLLSRFNIKGIAHITGGGLPENLPRILSKGLGIKLYRKCWRTPLIFKLIQKIGSLRDEEMFRTFNMGIGMALVVSQEVAQEILKEPGMVAAGASEIGEVLPSMKKKVVFA